MTTLSTAAEIETTASLDPAKIQILVAEDDDSLRKLLILTLKLDGYQVITARDGQEALMAFDSNLIDFVLLDINM